MDVIASLLSDLHVFLFPMALIVSFYLFCLGSCRHAPKAKAVTCYSGGLAFKTTYLIEQVWLRCAVRLSMKPSTFAYEISTLAFAITRGIYVACRLRYGLLDLEPDELAAIVNLMILISCCGTCEYLTTACKMADGTLSLDLS